VLFWRTEQQQVNGFITQQLLVADKTCRLRHLFVHDLNADGVGALKEH
jgi:hypothetical protein